MHTPFMLRETERQSLSVHEMHTPFILRETERISEEETECPSFKKRLSELKYMKFPVMTS